MKVAAKRDKLHYNTFIYACMPHIYMFQLIEILLLGPNQIFATFWRNILQDPRGQSSHFQVLMRFLKRVREAASRYQKAFVAGVG